jgi:hypothetical protein
VITDWGSTAAERARRFACDDLMPAPAAALWRAIDVQAPVEVTWRWLCQLAVAPYSYDWIDNLGRRSPRTLTPGLEHLEVGQRMVAVFRLAALEPGRSLTLSTRGRLFGEVLMTYEAVPAAGGSRIVAKILLQRRFGSRLLAAGDLVMMRKQLRTLRDLAQS